MKKKRISFWLSSILNSYAQIFFSLNRVLAVIILLVTFIDPFIGACGLFSIVITNLLALLFGLSKPAIQEGVYGFNALLLGLALGYEYQFNTTFSIVFLSAIILLLLNTIWLGSVLGKYKLPFLGLPFLFTYWLIYLAVGSFEFISLQEQYIYVDNLKEIGSKSNIYLFAHSLDKIQMPFLLKGYFKTLSATFFHKSILAGILISLGLLYHSRITFTLSFLGFFSAFLLFKLVGIPTTLLTDYLVGSNFIFFAIAIGGFYIIPSKGSYLSVIILIPVLSVFLIGFNKILEIYQLKSFTLAFSLLTILFLFVIQHLFHQKFVQFVSIQYYSAEKTIYKSLTASKRFKNAHLAKLILPFFGEWKVSQGYNGSITHLGEWSKALDFVITNTANKTYKDPGSNCVDYYCYNKPVIAPFDGYIYDIINHIEDNPINTVDTKHNWGNTIILNHQNGLFTQLSHLKKDSLKVSIGDYVTKGTILASCGNSGRSPEPHVHFQVQLSPKIGEVTYAYPISYYLLHKNNKHVLKTFEIPKENDVISNVEVNKLLKNNYDFQPGKTLRLTNKNNNKDFIEWVIKTDAWNRTYIHCNKTNATIWFENDGISFYCYDFEGDKKSLLYKFYLANYKILLANYTDLNVEDNLPANSLAFNWLIKMQDFIIPFYQFISANYVSSIIYSDNLNTDKIIIESKIESKLFNKKMHKMVFTMLHKEKTMQFTFNEISKTKTYICELY